MRQIWDKLGMKNFLGAQNISQEVLMSALATYPNPDMDNYCFRALSSKLCALLTENDFSVLSNEKFCIPKQELV